MKKTEKLFCDHCGAAMNEHRHSLNQGMLKAMKALFALARFDLANINVLGLTHNQMANFQKLRYWGLVAQKPGTQKTGEWMVTPFGLLFMQGKVSVPRVVWSYRAEVVRTENDRVTIYDIFPTSYRRHEDYAKEAKGRREVLS